MHAKPYNAILGEIFRCKYIHDDSVTTYLAEQVSHHPPVTAVMLLNKQKGFSVNATLKPKSKFHANSATTLLEGDITFGVHPHQEKYKVIFPSVLARGLIFGTQCIEVYEHLKLSCEKTGFSADINFVSSPANGVDGVVKKGNEILYKISGQITDKVMIQSTGTKKSMIFFDAHQLPKVIRYVKPVAKQLDYESRRVWHKVTYNIKKSEFTQANVEKHIVEQAQREIRAKREQKKEVWVPRHFKQISENIWHCIYFSEKEEPPLETFEVFQPDEHELRFIKKHFPNHKALEMAAKTNHKGTNKSTESTGSPDNTNTQSFHEESVADEADEQ
jgi:hypothetical protein